MATVVFRDESGQVRDIEDLNNYTGRISYEVHWGHEPSERAVQLHELGRQSGASGDHARALEYFKEANQVDPLWPYPLYDAAYTYLLEGDMITAENYYLQVDRLAPEGFFTVRTALDCLRRERESIIEPGLYLNTIMLEDLVDDDEKRQVLESILERNPAYPYAWQLLSDLLPTDEERLLAIEKGLACDPDSGTRGSLLLNRGLILVGTDNRESGIEILAQLANSESANISTKAIAEVVLCRLRK